MNQKYTVTKLPHICNKITLHYEKINDEDTKTEEQTTVTKETEEEKLLEKAEESEDSGEMEIMTEEERIHKECEKVINTIRREEFGIGIEL
jgi:hypothetical protein